MHATRHAHTRVRVVKYVLGAAVLLLALTRSQRTDAATVARRLRA